MPVLCKRKMLPILTTVPNLPGYKQISLQGLTGQVYLQSKEKKVKKEIIKWFLPASSTAVVLVISQQPKVELWMLGRCCLHRICN